MPKEYMSSIAKQNQPAVETEAQTIANAEKRVATYEAAIQNAKTPEEVIKFTDKLQEELDVLYAYYEEKSKEADSDVKLNSVIDSFVKVVTKSVKGTEQVINDLNEDAKKYEDNFLKGSKNPADIRTAKFIKGALAALLVSFPVVGGKIAYDVVMADRAEVARFEAEGEARRAKEAEAFQVEQQAENAEKSELYNTAMEYGILGEEWIRLYNEDQWSQGMVDMLKDQITIKEQELQEVEDQKMRDSGIIPPSEFGL